MYEGVETGVYKQGSDPLVCTRTHINNYTALMKVIWWCCEPMLCLVETRQRSYLTGFSLCTLAHF